LVRHCRAESSPFCTLCGHHRPQTGGEGASAIGGIVESSEDAIISKALDGTITSWNRGAERLFGYTAEEAIGQNITLIIPPDRLGEEATILERLRRGEPVEHFETRRMRKDGTLLDISLTISPMKDVGGRVVGASKVARDITERKMAEKALHEAHERLESLVERRTAAVRKLSSEIIRSQDDERRRISRELHNSLGQYLAHAKMSVTALSRPDATEKEKQGFSHLVGIIEKCLAETRTISYLLQPPLLDEIGWQSGMSKASQNVAAFP
jgi:PAS domain S-box-containing protein